MIRKRRLLIVSSLFLVFQLGECTTVAIHQQTNDTGVTNVNNNKVVNNDHVKQEQSSLSSSLMTTAITKNKKQQPLLLRGRGNEDQNNRQTRQTTYSSYTFCGVSCFSDQNCQGATDGCNFCNSETSTCYEPQPEQPINVCGLSCDTNNDCLGDEYCTFCNKYNVCSNSADGESRTCINSETAFQTALNDDSVKVVTLCGNTQLVLEEGDAAFTATRSAFTINCASGGNNCFILRIAGYGRLLEIDGGSVNVVGLRFDKGDTVTDASDITQDIGSNGDGGAIYIVGGNNNIENCIFRDNVSAGNGGAVNWNNGIVTTSKGFNNVGATNGCNGVYSRSTQTCDDTVNSGTNDQCGAYCSDTEEAWACDRVNGVCGVCDLTTNTCKQNASPTAPSTPVAPLPTPAVPTPSTPSPAPVAPVAPVPGEIDEICGTSCSVNGDCASSTTCNVCELSSVGIGLCVPEGARSTCVSTEATLREALQDPLQPVVQICTGTTIEVTSVLQISQSYKSLTCEGSERTCTLIRPSWVYDNFRLLRSSGNNVRLAYLTIQNGFSGGDGGGVLLEGDDNIILNVEFVGNHAERGGALAMGTGVVISSTFAGNSAKQCTNTYVISTGLCQN